MDLANIARSTYYYYLTKLSKSDKYEDIKNKIREIFSKSRETYGHRRITLELHKFGFKINKNTVLRLMNEIKLKCCVRMKKYKSYRGSVGKICDNILKREFNASGINKKWATDITEFSLFGEKLYLSPVIDLWNKEIVSYTISRRPVLKQVIDMVEGAFRKLPKNTKLILHSDQGWQYQHRSYQMKLKEKGIIQSMSRKGNCLDNSVIENFFGILKSELFYLKKFNSIDHFKEELVEYIRFYNNERIKINLKGMSPVQYRKTFLSK